MNDQTKQYYEALKAKEYRKERKPLSDPLPEMYEPPYDSDCYVRHYKKVLSEAFPILLPGDDFGFHKSCTDVSRGLRSGNYTLNYARVIGEGFGPVLDRLKVRVAKESDPEKRELGNAMIACIEEIPPIVEKYRKAAEDAGHVRLAEALKRIPWECAKTFYEACLFFQICIYFLRSGMTAHLGLGRFDQYMLPYFEADLKRGVPEEELFETLERFFISLNVDSDSYHGIQAGDNGQSIVLGGFNETGEYQFNRLSELCIEACRELKLIDPKINIRVGKNTPFEVYKKGTLLTKEGLGFPQYCNDDVVIPGLIALGYRPEDAYDYVVAACWEFIIPNVGADIPNRCSMDFPKIVSEVLDEHLTGAETFEDLFAFVDEKIRANADDFLTKGNLAEEAPLPLDAVFLDGCLESLKGVYSGGARYMNFGAHGPGIAIAADALMAVKELVYEKKVLTKELLLDALHADFEGYDDVRKLLLSCPKMGNNEDPVDELAGRLMESFAKHLNGRPAIGGGIWRAGTGSAQGYISRGKRCPATADGRKAGEPYPSSFSPALGMKTNGLLSTIQSFTKFDLKKVINGGPLTIEVHDTVFRNELGIEKTAMLVKEFIDLSGHQLQINAVNRETLLDAKAHPENYPNLIVRVWGWSVYFVELAPEYQDHIIKRLEFEY